MTSNNATPELAEISDTFQRYSNDFGRKLYLIQNSIYGVDIQPVATQIAKLRFFISLGHRARAHLRPQPRTTALNPCPTWRRDLSLPTPSWGSSA